MQIAISLQRSAFSLERNQSRERVFLSLVMPALQTWGFICKRFL